MHLCRCEVSHRADAIVVCVQDDDAVRLRPRDQLRFRFGNVLDAAELAQVGARHGEHHGHVRGRNRGEVVDVADVVGSHFQDQGRGVLASAQHRQWQAELVVERSRRGDDWPADG